MNWALVAQRDQWRRGTQALDDHEQLIHWFAVRLFVLRRNSPDRTA
jgi:hypothetical protein